MLIHTIGDSHASNIHSGWRECKNVITHHIGPILCYSFGKEKLDRIDIRNYGINDGDSIVFCLGEIDCRCHIHKYINPITTYQSVIDTIIDNYFEAIDLNISTSHLKLKTVCIYNVIPPTQTTEYSCIGSGEERKIYTLYFNKKLKENCIKNNYIFFDIYDKCTDIDGYLSPELSDGTVHIYNGEHINNFINRNNIREYPLPRNNNAFVIGI